MQPEGLSSWPPHRCAPGKWHLNTSTLVQIQVRIWHVPLSLSMSTDIRPCGCRSASDQVWLWHMRFLKSHIISLLCFRGVKEGRTVWYGDWKGKYFNTLWLPCDCALCSGHWKVWPCYCLRRLEMWHCGEIKLQDDNKGYFPQDRIHHYTIFILLKCQQMNNPNFFVHQLVILVLFSVCIL